MQLWTGEYVELMNYWRSFIESEESPQEVDQYLDRIHLKAYDESGRWEIRQRLLGVSEVTHKDASSTCNADAAMIHDCFAMVAQSQYQQIVAKQLGDSRKLRRAWRRVIEKRIGVEKDIMAEYWPRTPWEEHKLTAGQRETYYDVVRSWSHFNVNFLGNYTYGASLEPDYGCLDILQEFSKMPTLDIVPEYERGALRELFQKIDNEVDLSPLEISCWVKRAFIKLGMGLFLACSENLACELALEEKLSREVEREERVKAKDWRRNMLGVMSENKSIIREWPLRQYLLYIRGNKEPLESFWEATKPWETVETDEDHSVTEGQ